MREQIVYKRVRIKEKNIPQVQTRRDFDEWLKGYGVDPLYPWKVQCDGDNIYVLQREEYRLPSPTTNGTDHGSVDNVLHSERVLNPVSKGVH